MSPPLAGRFLTTAPTGKSIFFIFEDSPYFFHSRYTNLHSHKQHMKVPLSTLVISTLVISCLFDNRQSKGRKSVYYCGLDLHFHTNQ